jgi:Ser/Thr protein kinase RdoA (MazF antagonist)
MPSIKEPLAQFHAATEGMAQRPCFASSLDLLHVDSGGGVDLAAMPAEVAAACRDAWSALVPAPLVAVHGDLFPENLIMTATGAPALIAWDEARLDLAVFDLAAVAGKASPAVVRRARIAWETACCWQLEPTYARRLLAEGFTA